MKILLERHSEKKPLYPSCVSVTVLGTMRLLGSYSSLLEEWRPRRNSFIRTGIVLQIFTDPSYLHYLKERENKRNNNFIRTATSQVLLLAWRKTAQFLPGLSVLKQQRKQPEVGCVLSVNTDPTSYQEPALSAQVSVTNFMHFLLCFLESLISRIRLSKPSKDTQEIPSWEEQQRSTEGAGSQHTLAELQINLVFLFPSYNPKWMYLVVARCWD